ncbi:23S rRNA (adenine(2503)-C(2))-methyltransferase RlmN [bacterium]|nr:23S rRNA (adenine(2503)-C(2))-methyltransferase RlmN [bacterium]
MNQFEGFITKHNLPKYRLNQLEQQYYRNCIEDWDSLSTFPLDIREKLKEEVPIFSLHNTQCITSKDGKSEKLLAYTVDSKAVEAVLMKSDKRITVCISCMSGCPVGCLFCSTGQMGYYRSLTTREIVDQVMYFKRKLYKQKEDITNVVFMGMGEPMLNLDSVLQAIDILVDKMGMSVRHITVSTSGYIPQLKKFMKVNRGVKIAISLHAPNQEIREKIMPTVAKVYPLDSLMKTLIEYQKKTNKRITYEYTMMDGVNDSKENAEELSTLLKHQLCLVNLIRYNDSMSDEFKKSSSKKIRDFQNILTKNGINNTLRHSYGNDIYAACGQLATIKAKSE